MNALLRFSAIMNPQNLIMIVSLIMRCIMRLLAFQCAGLRIARGSGLLAENMMQTAVETAATSGLASARATQASHIARGRPGESLPRCVFRTLRSLVPTAHRPSRSRGRDRHVFIHLSRPHHHHCVRVTDVVVDYGFHSHASACRGLRHKHAKPYLQPQPWSSCCLFDQKYVQERSCSRATYTRSPFLPRRVATPSLVNRTRTSPLSVSARSGRQEPAT